MKDLSINPDHLIFFLFLLLLGLGLAHHELWYDESLHWLLARDSQSLQDLLKYNKQEGHPILWTGLLYIITQFTHDPQYMQWLHYLIVAIAIYIFIYKSPFNTITKALFVFGYFPLFEYSMISRNYALTLLFLFLILSLTAARTQKYWLIGILLILLTNSHFLGGILAITIMIVLTFDFLQNKVYLDSGSKNQFFLCILLLISGFFIMLLQIIPHEYELIYKRNDEQTLYRAGRTFMSLLKSFVPIPDFKNPNFWNTNFFIEHFRVYSIVFAIFLAIVPFFIFYRKNLSLILFYAGTICVFGFIFWIQKTQMRYAGFIYILFISAYWLHYSKIPQRQIYSFYHLKQVLKIINFRWRTPFLYAILIFHLIGGFLAFRLDYIRPFSQAKNAVSYLKKHGLEDETVAGMYCSCMPISSYLKKPVYYPQIGDYAGYCHIRFQGANSEINTLDPFLDQIKDYMSQATENLYLILHRPLKEHNLLFEDEVVYTNEHLQITFMKSFEGGIIEKENYYLYRVSNY